MPLLLGSLLAVLLLAVLGDSAALIASAAGLDSKNSGEFSGIVGAADKIRAPLAAAAAGCAPLALVLGAIFIQAGHRRGLAIVGTTFGAIILLGAAVNIGA